MIFFLKEYLKHLLHLPAKTENLQHILIIRNDHIGDVVLSLPVLHAIRRAWPEAKIYYLTGSYTADLLSNSSDIDHLIIQKKDENLSSLAARINAYPIDCVFNFNATAANAALVRNLKAHIKVGYAYKPYNIISHNRFVFIHRSRPPIHESAFMLEFLKTLGIGIRYNTSIHPLMFLMKHVSDMTTHSVSAVLTSGLLPVDPKARIFMKKYLKNKKAGQKKIIAIHAGDNKSADNWSARKYIDFAAHLSKKIGQRFDLFIILGPTERTYIKEAHERTSSCSNIRIIDSDLSLKQLVAFLDRIHLIVSGSTGPMHIAGALGKKIVGLFPSNKAECKEKWGPLNMNRIILESDHGKSVEEGICERDVEKAVLRMIR